MHRSKSRLLFNHLVGAGEQSRRDNKPERFGRLQVDDKLKLGDGVGMRHAVRTLVGMHEEGGGP